MVDDQTVCFLPDFRTITSGACLMTALDPYFFVEWLSAWLVLNWGAHLALSQNAEEPGRVRRSWPRLAEQFPYILHAAVIGWLIQWSWQLLPPIG